MWLSHVWQVGLRAAGTCPLARRLQWKLWGIKLGANVNILIQIGPLDIAQAVWKLALFWYGCFFLFFLHWSTSTQ